MGAVMGMERGGRRSEALRRLHDARRERVRERVMERLATEPQQWALRPDTAVERMPELLPMIGYPLPDGLTTLGDYVEERGLRRHYASHLSRHLSLAGYKPVARVPSRGRDQHKNCDVRVWKLADIGECAERLITAWRRSSLRRVDHKGRVL